MPHFESTDQGRAKLHEKTDFWRNVPTEHAACGLGFAVARNEEATALTLPLAKKGLCAMANRTGATFEVGDGSGMMFETETARTKIEAWFAKGLEGHNTNAIPTLSIGNFFFERGMEREHSDAERQSIAARLKTRGV